jgi:hypothetical protein
MLVKGWSVTLSLAGLGLGFQQQHHALFALAAGTALAFWYIDVLLKGFQLRYYARMRDIEYAAYRINAVPLKGLDRHSAPRIDMSWAYRGQDKDWRTNPPERRSPDDIRRLLRLRYVMPQVLLPHAVAVVVGTGLFVAALLDAPGLDRMQP